MQITFDPRDQAASASVLAIVAALHDPAMIAATLGFEFDAMGTARQTFSAPTPVTPETETIQVFESVDEQPDPAAAFGDAGNGATPAAPTFESGTAPAANTASPSSVVELDADGLPWDARIHSGPADKKPKNADGRWRSRRGTDEATVAAVTAELRRVMGAPVPTPAAAPTPPAPTPAAAPTPPAPTPAAVVPPPPAPAVAEAPTSVATPPPPTPPAADTAFGQAGAETAASPPPSPPTAAAPSTDFAELMKRITARQTAGTLTVAQTKATAEALGLTGVADLLKRPDLIPAFGAALPPEAA